MKLSDVPGELILRFEEGHAPGEPVVDDGYEQEAYRAWREAGGKVKPAPVVTEDDL